MLYRVEVCDRCKAENKNNLRAEIGRFRQISFAGTTIDLCPDCCDSLERFLTQPIENTDEKKVLEVPKVPEVINQGTGYVDEEATEAAEEDEYKNLRKQLRNLFSDDDLPVEIEDFVKRAMAGLTITQTSLERVLRLTPTILCSCKRNHRTYPYVRHAIKRFAGVEVYGQNDK